MFCLVDILMKTELVVEGNSLLVTCNLLPVVGGPLVQRQMMTQEAAVDLK